MVGPPYAVTSVGGDVAWQWGAFGAVVAALMSMFIVGRHTRGEEQSGRSELVRASVVGRNAPLTAALIVAVLAQLVMGAATTLVMIGADTPAAGSISLGASLAAVGILFAAVAAVAVQVSEGTGGAYGLVGAVLGASFALRAAGDVGDGTLSWLSPIGWGQAMRPYADERWWPLALFLVATALLLALAFALLARRDEGAGLLAPRPGPPTAARTLTRPMGLAFRLQRAALAAWAVGLFFGGLSIGLTAQDADSILGDSKEVDELFAQAAGSLVDNYLAVSLLSMALIGTGFALAAVLKMRAEETAGRLEPLLATALARPRWAGGYVAVAALGTVVVLAASGLGAGIADAANSNDLGRLPLLVGSSIALAPAVWVLIGLGVALFGLLRARDRGRVGRARGVLPRGVPRPAAGAAGLGDGHLAVHACAVAAGRGVRRGAAAGVDGGRRGVVRRRARGLPPAERARVANVNCGWVGERVCRPRRSSRASLRRMATSARPGARNARIVDHFSPRGPPTSPTPRPPYPAAVDVRRRYRTRRTARMPSERWPSRVHHSR